MARRNSAFGNPTVRQLARTPLAKPLTALAVGLLLATVAAAEPVVETLTIGTKDAPRLKTAHHGRIGQNVDVTSWELVPSPGGDSLFGLCAPIRTEDDGFPELTPPLIRIDIGTGRLSEYLKKTEMVNRAPAATPTAAPDAVLSAEPPRMRMLHTGWRWDTPTCFAADGAGRFFIGDKAGRIVRLDPKENLFEEFLALKNETPTGIAFAGGKDIAVMCRSGMVYTLDMLGLELLGHPDLGRGPVAGLAVDAARVFYTAVGPAPWRLFAFTGRGKQIKVRRLLPDMAIDGIQLRTKGDIAWCEVRTREDGKETTRHVALSKGKAEPLAASPLGYELEVDFRTQPAVVVHAKGKAPRPIDVIYKDAPWGRVKSITVGPDGKKVYGGTWPTYWIYEYDPDTGRIRRPGTNYVWYEITPFNGLLYVISYYGIRHMAWDPTKPWNFTWQEHYYGKKSHAGHSSPFGSKDSNPRLICMFRYMRNLNIRRPAGFAVGGDGRLYCGAKNPGVLFYVEEPPHTFTSGYRYSGALCWYDPTTETIGQEREPYLHHEVTDICRVVNY